MSKTLAHIGHGNPGLTEVHVSSQAFKNDVLPSSKLQKPVKNESQPLLKEKTAVKYALWGDDNMRPHEVVDVIRNNNQLATGLYWKTLALVSGGLVYGYNVVDENGKESFKRVIDPKVEEWNRKTNVNRYLRESTHDFYALWNIFPKMTTNLGRNYIERIECINTPWVRLAVQDQKDGLIKSAWINANWKDNGTTDDGFAKEYPVINPYVDPDLQFSKISKPEFIYPIAGSDFDYTYYAKAPWWSIIDNGWLDVNSSIPKFKAALMDRQYSIKYHFVMSETYWEWKYPKWHEMTEKEQKAAFENEVLFLNKKMAGAEKAGGNILSICQVDPNTKQNYPGLQIIAVDDKIKDGIYIEDSQEASSHIYNALGIDATLVASMPGKNLAGSGSDKRVAYNIYLANCKPEADLILEPIEFAYRINKFGPEFSTRGPLKCIFRNYWLATQDISKEPQQQAS